MTQDNKPESMTEAWQKYEEEMVKVNLPPDDIIVAAFMKHAFYTGAAAFIQLGQDVSMTLKAGKITEDQAKDKMRLSMREIKTYINNSVQELGDAVFGEMKQQGMNITEQPDSPDC